MKKMIIDFKDMKLDLLTLDLRKDSAMIIDIWELIITWPRNLIKKLKGLSFIIILLIAMLLLFWLFILGNEYFLKN
jgi:hypothetical protein